MPQLFSVFFPRQLYAGYGAAFLGFQPLSFLGRHSLAVYLVHQPLLYLAFRLAA
ncbi:MAG: heparan-alpha-glucosaminide N-acetyltransferase domain-containing protein [Candidatus Faecivivens sp.]|nr:heparan-alpha-glucosaminide N-acetyltransferase domain-containing protein [Candidatus Faecivivens sp.]